MDFSVNMSRIDHNHESFSPEMQGINIIDKQFSTDRGADLQYILKTAMQQNMVPGQTPKTDHQIGFSAYQPPIEPEPAYHFSELSQIPS